MRQRARDRHCLAVHGLSTLSLSGRRGFLGRHLKGIGHNVCQRFSPLTHSSKQRRVHNLTSSHRSLKLGQPGQKLFTGLNEVVVDGGQILVNAHKIPFNAVKPR